MRGPTEALARAIAAASWGADASLRRLQITEQCDLAEKYAEHHWWKYKEIAGSARCWLFEQGYDVLPDAATPEMVAGSGLEACGIDARRTYRDMLEAWGENLDE